MQVYWDGDREAHTFSTRQTLDYLLLVIRPPTVVDTQSIFVFEQTIDLTACLR